MFFRRDSFPRIATASAVNPPVETVPATISVAVDKHAGHIATSSFPRRAECDPKSFANLSSFLHGRRREQNRMLYAEM